MITKEFCLWKKNKVNFPNVSIVFFQNLPLWRRDRLFFDKKKLRILSSQFRLNIKSSEKLPLGEYGRQRTSTKFHDLVLSLRSQNSRVLETPVFLALFSLWKVFNLLKWIKNKSHFFENHLAVLWKTIVCLHSKLRT